MTNKRLRTLFDPIANRRRGAGAVILGVLVWTAASMLAMTSAEAKTANDGIALDSAPLFLSGQHKPNVMIELDTSGRADSELGDRFENFLNNLFGGRRNFAGRQDIKFGTMLDYVLDRNYNPWDTPDGWIGDPPPTLAGRDTLFMDADWLSSHYALELPSKIHSDYGSVPTDYLKYLFDHYAKKHDEMWSEGNPLDWTGLGNTDREDLSETIPGTRKITSARWVVRDLVDINKQGDNFGITTFNGKFGGINLHKGEGGTPWVATDEDESADKVHAFVDEYATTGKLGLVQAPLAETLYEITRYFQGEEVYQGVNRTSFEKVRDFFTGTTNNNPTMNGNKYKSPIKNACQNNYAVAVTTGHPTMDSSFDGENGLPDYDDKGDRQSEPPFDRFSDGKSDDAHLLPDILDYDYQPDENLYFDDVAKFAYDTNMGNNDDHEQPLYTYVIGFSDHNQMLEDAAEYGHGAFVHYQDAQRLGHVWQKVLNSDIKREHNSAADLATNASDPRRGRTLYQTTFDSEIWAGHLRAISAGGNAASSGETVDTNAGLLWDAAAQLASQDPDERKIYTFDGDRKIDFKWDHLTDEQKTALESNPKEYKWANLTEDDKTYDNGTSRDHLYDNPIETGDDYHENETIGKARLAYLRGETALDLPDGRMLRRRYRSDGSACDAGNADSAGYCNVLGDMAHSRPVYAGAPQDLTLGNGYQSFRAEHMADTPLIYVGANDGMLHAFNAETGKERFAYVPNAIFDKLNHLTSPLAIGLHKYYVDGQQTVHPAYFGGQWHSVLVGTLGRGGRGVYALDVTGGKLNDVLWELTAEDQPKLGYTLGKASIVQSGGVWYAVFGNGYNSDSGEAVLFVVDIASGELTTAGIDTDVGDHHGLASPAVVDRYGDKSADYIYAGDLHGNLWKFDATNGIGGMTAKRLFAAERNGHAQPITEQPEVGNDPDGGVFVYFGTGKFLEKSDYFDDGGARTQTLYGIRDRAGHAGHSFASDTNLRRGDLVQQTILTSNVTTPAAGSGPALRLGTTTANDLDTDESNGAVDHGWYLDLGVKGERQVTQPVLRAKNRIVFTTKTPSRACGTDGQTRLYDLNSLTGGRPDYSPFDTNFDGQFDKDDFIRVDGQAVPAVMRTISGLGLSGQPSIISNGDGTETKYLSGSHGRIKQINERSTDPHLSWQQLQ